MPAGQAQAQIHPTVAHLEALFAAFGLGLDALDLIEMGASLGHAGSFVSPRFTRGESHCGLHRNAYLETRVAGNRLDGDEAAHFLDDAMHDVEAEPGAFAHALSGEKRLEDAGLHFRGMPGPLSTISTRTYSFSRAAR